MKIPKNRQNTASEAKNWRFFLFLRHRRHTELAQVHRTGTASAQVRHRRAQHRHRTGTENVTQVQIDTIRTWKRRRFRQNGTCPHSVRFRQNGTCPSPGDDLSLISDRTCWCGSHGCGRSSSGQRQSHRRCRQHRCSTPDQTGHPQAAAQQSSYPLAAA